MNALLIYPGLVDGFDSYRKGSDWFNHGLGIISAVLKGRGHGISYLDCRKFRGWTDVARALDGIAFDIALISVATVDFDAARTIAGTVKAKRPGVRVVVGGPHPTLMTEETAAAEEFDHVFTHEAEITLPQILSDIARAPRVIRGEMPADLDALPFVDRSLAPGGETPAFKEFERPYFSITASRGCLYNCTFCQPAERALFGNKVRKRSVGNVLAELELLARERGMRSFMIHDDCFTQYAAWVEEFCDEKRRRNLPQPFACQSRADIVCRRPELMKKLAAAGLRWAFIGFESGSDRVLRYLKKGTTVAQNLEAARICRGNGIRIFANYMFGVPTETAEEMAQTAEMIRTIRPDFCSPSVFTPAPGSTLYSYCRDNDLILIGSSEGYRRDSLSGAKIKGTDYDLVDRMAYESIHGKTMGRARYHLLHGARKLLRHSR